MFLGDEVLSDATPTVYTKVTYSGNKLRNMYDRRSSTFNYLGAHCFDTMYTDETKLIEFQVNPEFTKEEAEVEAAHYANIIGRMPKCLREGVHSVWIHKGDHPWGGGNNNLLIHTGIPGERKYEKEGIVDEALMHEGVHSSLDLLYKDSAGWKLA